MDKDDDMSNAFVKLDTNLIIKFHKPFEDSRSWEVIYPDGGGNWIAWDKDSP